MTPAITWMALGHHEEGTIAMSRLCLLFILQSRGCRTSVDGQPGHRGCGRELLP